MKSFTLQASDVHLFIQSTSMRRARVGINLLLIVWIAWMLATLARSLVWPPPAAELEPVEVKSPSLQIEGEKRLVDRLPGWHLFGQVQEVPVAPDTPDVPPDAPETQLTMVLRGVLASENPQTARAIVADGHGHEEMYAIGDILPGKVELHGIHATRVILLHGGRYETLHFPHNEETRPVTVPHAIANARPNIAPVRVAKHQDSRPEFLNRRATSLSQLLKIQRKWNAAGPTGGFTVHPNIDPELFKQVGLRAGDELTRIGGIATDTAAKLYGALQRAKSGDAVTLTVLRDGREMQLSFTLPESQ